MTRSKSPTFKCYNFVFKFRYFLPGGLSDVKTGEYHCQYPDVEMAINDFNRYTYATFKGLTIELYELKRRKIKIFDNCHKSH